MPSQSRRRGSAAPWGELPIARSRRGDETGGGAAVAPRRGAQPISTEEQVAITLGAITPWRDAQLAVKGFSGDPADPYAKLIVRTADQSHLVRLAVGEQQVVGALRIRLDAVPEPSPRGGRPGPTGRGRVLVTVSEDGDRR